MADGPSLPRSIRWRLQLGLLGLPDATDENEHCSLKEIYEYNASLLCDQRKRYKELVEKHEEALKAFMEADDTNDDKGETKDEAPAAAETDNDSNTVLDPLTAMLREQEAQEKRRQELELKYRKERARRNRGIYEGVTPDSPNGTPMRPQSHESVEVIDKDLHRLQPDHHTYHHSRKRLSQEDDDFDTSVQERTARLAEILVIHAREHADLHYRQGMHEILSYLLLVIEMDLYDIESMLQSGTVEEEQSLSLLDASFLVPDTYIMFERVMSNLSPAYDVKQSPSQASSPMEEMGRSVVSQLKNVVCDQALYNVVKAMHCPPELYCTRWVRLMFSREVLGWRNVLLLWDVFFDLITCHDHITSMEPDKYSKPGVSPRLQLGRFNLMQVLESTAASMILLQRDALIEADHNESIHILMNVPPLKNVLPLTATLLSLMRRLQVGPEGLMPSTSIANLSASFGQMARGAFQQIESMAPTAGESFRKFYDSALVPGAATKAASAPHPLATLEANNEAAASLEKSRGVGRALSGRHSALADSLKASTLTITDYLMQVESNGRSSAISVPEKIWEALAQIETVRKQLLDEF